MKEPKCPKCGELVKEHGITDVVNDWIAKDVMGWKTPPKDWRPGEDKLDAIAALDRMNGWEIRHWYSYYLVVARKGCTNYYGVADTLPLSAYRAILEALSDEMHSV